VLKGRRLEGMEHGAWREHGGSMEGAWSTNMARRGRKNRPIWDNTLKLITTLEQISEDIKYIGGIIIVQISVLH
jgi:hypothetical protein